MTPEQGDIVLVPVPFTDLSSHKRRPVIVISASSYNRSAADVVVVAMTSSPATAPYSFPITTADLVAGALNRPGTVRGARHRRRTDTYGDDPLLPGYYSGVAYPV